MGTKQGQGTQRSDGAENREGTEKDGQGDSGGKETARQQNGQECRTERGDRMHGVRARKTGSRRGLCKGRWKELWAPGFPGR